MKEVGGREARFFLRLGKPEDVLGLAERSKRTKRYEREEVIDGLRS